MILFAFLLSLVAFSLQLSIYGSSLPILPFIPFVILSALLRPLSKALFYSCLAGFLVDVLGADPFGIHALNYTLIAALCYRNRSRFSAEAPVQLSLCAAFGSFVSTQLQILLLFLFDRRILFEGKWWIAEWTLLPLFDGLYTFIWFTGPLALFRKIRRMWMVYWLRKKNPFPN